MEYDSLSRCLGGEMVDTRDSKSRAKERGGVGTCCCRTRNSPRGTWGIDDLQVPRLNEPLISDEDRRIQLQQKLNLYKIGKNEIRDLAELSSRLEKAVLIEKKIEAALVSDGYDPDQIIYRIKDAKYSFYTQGGRCFCEPWMII
ncbi:hypothetical protein Pint_34152 [Pistacia integerrima]|uniref:Uncharacterized protein n=1 Tax=Pistacia integerrima TaxID=434235 RepID=A0ACC0X5K0_9ROSI|nr:hypothetical protein Pint_34152 [Pistacia integerrima]